MIIICVLVLNVLLHHSLQSVDNSTDYFEVRATVENDTGYEESWFYREEIKEDPDDQDTDFRRRRAEQPEVVQTVSRGCVNVTDTGQGQQVQRALVVDQGTTVKLPCYVCGVAPQSPHLWYKFVRMKQVGRRGTLWKAKELDLDAHDDEEENRVFTDDNHTLTVRDFQHKDVGTYFCTLAHKLRNETIIFRSEDIEAIGAVAMAVAWKYAAHARKAPDLLYHLDMAVDVRNWLVHEDGTGYPPPAPPATSQKHNYHVHTSWGAWGRCNRCGEPGERRRKGRCIVKLQDQHKASYPEYLDHVLRLYPEGVPCHSSLFYNFAIFMSRKNEIQVTSCRVPCKEKKKKKKETKLNIPFINSKKVERMRAFVDRIKIFGFGKKKKKEPEERTLSVVQGESLLLHCPGATVDSLIHWRNHSAHMPGVDTANRTANRILVDAMFNLNFSLVFLLDNSTYSCWEMIDNKTQEVARYHVMVRYIPPPPDVGPYLLWLVGLHGVHFVVLVVFEVFKFRNRIKQIRR